MSINTNTALEYLKAGLSVLPAEREKKYPAVGSWKTWQTRLPTEIEVKAWFSNNHDAVCIICGDVSGNLEILDFDHHGELFPKWKASIPVELYDKLAVEQTPSGGYHVVYRCSNKICGSLKLAQGKRDGKLVTLIETRGNGGLFLCSPTPGYKLIQSSFDKIQIISQEERKAVLSAAYELNEHTPEMERESAPTFPDPNSQFEVRPGDDFNARGNVREILVAHGWTPIGKQGDGNELWRRPGKSGGRNSATLKDNVFYVFSSNASPFSPGNGYAPFNVYTLLEHNGDYTAAANALFTRGFGKAREIADVDLSAFLEKGTVAEASRPRQSCIRSLDQLLNEFPAMKPELIHGILRVGETMNIIASPKTGKSWLVTDLAAAVATGSEWFGFPCEQGKVLIIDNELHPETSACRIPKVIRERGYPEKVVARNLFIENQRGNLHDINSLRGRIEEFKKYEFKLIIIDAFYRAMPPDMEENDNAKMAGIYNTLDQIAGQLNCAFVLIHHTTKGNQANKSVTDMGAGAGSQSRAADAHIVLRRHTEPDAVVLEAVVRSFPPVRPIGLRWQFPVWVYDPNLDVTSLEGKIEKSPGARDVDFDAELERIGELLGTPLPKTELTALIQGQLGTSRNHAREIIEYGKALGVLDEIPATDPDNPRKTYKMIFKT